MPIWPPCARFSISEMAGGMTDRLKTLQAVWREAGFTANGFADIHQLIWEKYICNVFFERALYGFDCTIGALVSHEARREIALGCMREAYQAGLARGINFPLMMQMHMR